MNDYDDIYEEEITAQDTDITESIVLASNTRLTKEEREFFLNYDELNEVWVAETSIPKFWRRLEKKNWTCTGVQYYPDGQVCSKTFTSGNSKGVTITDPTKVRVMSEEDKEKARQRFLAMRNSKDSPEEGLQDD